MSQSIERPSGYISQTRRIGIIRIVAIGVIALVLVSRDPWGAESLAGSLMRSAGIYLIMIAVVGRLWSTLYIGGRKNAYLVTTGPYSVTRNPLYCFSILGAVGTCLMLGSIVAALILGCSIAVILSATARAEASMLSRRFGATYEGYAARVPLLLPRPRLYQESDVLTFRPQALLRALGDGLLFLIAAPVAQLLTWAKGAGLLPQLVALF